MKKTFSIFLFMFAFAFAAKAQQVDSIYFNLYTDSLKKGPLHFNYINVDGKLSNGSYFPLDTTHVRFTTSVGKMKGNVLTLDSNVKDAYVIVTATLISNPAIKKDVKIYIKKILNDELLKTEEELVGGWQQNNRTKH